MTFAQTPPPKPSAPAARKRPARPAKPAPAKPDPNIVPEIREWPIASLAVEGNANYSASAIVAASGLKPGEPANKERFEAARERLLATGAFDSVGYRYFTASDGRSYEAVWQIVEAAPLYPFKLEELPAELATMLRDRDPLYANRIPATRQKIDQWTQWLSERFGKPVTGKVEADAPERLAIVFRPAGNAPNIAEVRFLANKIVPSTVLRPAINGVAVGVPYQEARFRQLLDSQVRPIYEARGRLRVSFPKVDVARATDVNGVVITVSVDEGDVYKLGNVELKGDGIPQAELAAAGDFKSGDIANMQAVQEGLERIRLQLRRQGHLMATVSPERRLDEPQKTIHVDVLVDPGPRYIFSRLLIRGLDIETEPVIRKMWGLKEGAPFNPEYPDNFLRRVIEEQVFENPGKPGSAQKIDEAARTVEVTLLFGSAAKPKSILPSAPKQP